jgi:hypothetical protein
VIVFLVLTAARPARILTQTAEVFEEPAGDSTVLENLPFDTGVAVSNEPTEGFYKVRTPSGKVGWISGTVLQLEGEAPETSASPERATGLQDPFSNARLRVSLMGGGVFSDWVDMNVLFGTTGVTTLVQAGAEIEWRFAPRFGLLLRGDWQSSTRVISDLETGANFTVVSSSLPLLLGLNAVLVKSSRFELGLGGLLGVSPLTWMSTEELPNTSGADPTVASTLGFVGQARLSAALQVVSRFAVVFEGGWGLQITNLTRPLVSASGSDLWKNSATQEFVPASFSQSGPFLGAGLRIYF